MLVFPRETSKKCESILHILVVLLPCTVMRLTVSNSAFFVVHFTLMVSNHTNVSPCRFTACLPSFHPCCSWPTCTYVCRVLLSLDRQSRHGAGGLRSPGDNDSVWPQGDDQWLEENQTLTLRWVVGAVYVAVLEEL